MDPAVVGRQPIFDDRLDVFGYELLFRTPGNTRASFGDGDQATATVLMSTLADIGLDRVVGSRLAFVNVTQSLLLSGHMSILPADRVVLEILEDVQPTDEVVTRVRELSEAGYTIALDDVVHCRDVNRLLPHANIVKLDLPLIAADQLGSEIERYKELDVRVLAEKVETQADFERCKELGCDYFQGYFFCRPQVMHGRKIRPANVSSVVRLFTTVQDPEVSMDDVEGALTADANLSYKVLRFVNSARCATMNEIESLRHAVVVTGIRRICSFAAMVLLENANTSKPSELMTVAMVRAKMCELLADRMKFDKTDRFLTVGLLSVMDALLDAPMDEVVKALPLTEDMNQALLKHEGPMGETLASVLMYERGDWDGRGGIDHVAVREVYLESLDWAMLAARQLEDDRRDRRTNETERTAAARQSDA